MKLYHFSDDMLEEIGLQLAPRVSRGLKRLQKAQPKVRIKADSAEFILSEAIRLAKLGPSGYTQGSHEIRQDMWMSLPVEGKNDKEDISVSHKTGVLDLKDNKIQFSGYRLGRFDTIEDRVKAIQKSSADLFIFIGGEKKAKASDPYYLTILPGKSLNYGNPSDWSDNDKRQEYSNSSLKASINKSMSHQLWTTVNLKENTFIVEL